MDSIIIMYLKKRSNRFICDLVCFVAQIESVVLHVTYRSERHCMIIWFFGGKIEMEQKNEFIYVS